MADQKISELNTITGANVDDASDKLAIVDASGNETKAITREELFKSVDGTTFHVDSTNNRVGVGTITPSVDFEVDGDVAVSDAFPTVQLRDKNSTGTSIGGLFALTNVDATDPIAWFGVPDEDGVVHVRAFYGDIVLRPGSSASTTEVMRLQDNGRVGINISSPLAAFHADVSSNLPVFRISRSDINNYAEIDFEGSEFNLDIGDTDGGGVGIDFVLKQNGTETVRVDTSGNVTINSGVVKLNGNTINSIQVTVADDAVAELTFTNRNGGMLTVHESADDDSFPDSSCYFLGYFDFGSSPATNTAVKGGLTDIVTTTLTGTTGTDGRVTIGGTGGTLYIENRRGSALVFNVTLM